MSAPIATPLRNGTAPGELDDVIAEAQKEFGAVLVKARNSSRARAAAIHPGLQPHGLIVLTLLSQSGPQQQRRLAQEMGSDKAMMSRTIKQLESFNLITRTVDPSDGRVQVVSMTPEARTRFDASRAQASQVLHDRLSQWDIEEVRQFAGLLSRLNQTDF